MNHETLWAREGDVMRQAWEAGHWSAFSSRHGVDGRRAARIQLHGFDFRVESHAGTKTMVKEEAS